MCDRPTKNGKTHDVCRLPLGLDGFLCFSQYAEPVSTVVHSIKYEGVFDAIREQEKTIEERWPAYAPAFDSIIAIPMTPRKKQSRGYNQAELLARKLAEFLRVPHDSSALIKIRDTVPQMRLSKAERVQNSALKQSFVCIYPSRIRGKTIALVDDVATTRSTLLFACHVLKKAGAQEVWGVVYAHAYG